MAITDEIIKISVQTELDHKSVQKLSRDISDVQKRLGKTTVSFNKVAKQAQSNIKDVAHLSGVTEAFADKLSKATKDSAKAFKGLGDELESAIGDLNALSAAAGKAPTAEAQRDLMQAASKAATKVNDLNKQIEKQKQLSKNQFKEVSNVTKSLEKFSGDLKNWGKYGGKELGKDLSSGIQRTMKDPLGGMTQILGGLVKGVRGGAARKASTGMAAAGGTAQMGGMARTAMMFAKASGALAGVVAGTALMLKGIEAISSKMATLNKTLVKGLPMAADWAGTAADSAQLYESSISKMRRQSLVGQKSFKDLGSNAEGAMSTIEAFTKHASGSVLKTSLTLAKMGGSVEQGFQHFAQSAMIYGKALGMESEQVAGMMGDWVSEMGTAAGRTVDLMGTIVSEARTANIPVHKFMDIFRGAIPHLDLFTNRIEQLTTTISVLSRTMRPDQVKNFMEAFAKGFKGVDFKQRLKTALIVGVPKMNKIIARDFENASKDIAKNLESSVGEDFGAKFQKAFKDGPDAMRNVIAEAQKMGATGPEIAKALELASYEETRRKGGALNIATAMKKLGMGGRYETLKSLSQSFTSGFDGLSEHVIKQLGISEEEYNALRDMYTNAEQTRKEIRQNGLTNSKSLNDALLLQQGMKLGILNSEDSQQEQIAQLRSILYTDTDNGKKLMKAMQNVSDVDIINAKEGVEAVEAEKITLENLAQKQYNVTKSMSEKLSDIIDVLLGKLMVFLESFSKTIEKYLIDLMSFLGEDEAKSVSAIARTRQMEATTKEEKEKYRVFGNIVGQNAAAEASGKETVAALTEAGVFKGAKFNIASLKGVGDQAEFDYETQREVYKKLLDKGDQESITKALGMLGNKDIMKASKFIKTSGLYKDPSEFTSNVTKKSGPVNQKQIDELANLINKINDLETQFKDGDNKGMMENRAKLIRQAQDLSPALSHIKVKKGDEKTENLLDEIRAGSEDQTSETEELKKDSKKSTKIQKSQETALKSVDKKLERVKLDKTSTQITMEQALYKAFSRGLLEFVPVLARMWDDVGFRQGLTAPGARQFIEGGAGLGDLYAQGGNVGSWGSGPGAWKWWNDTFSDMNQGSRQLGGAINTTGLYKMHKGEYVIPASEAAGGGKGGGNTNITVNFDIKSNNPVAVAAIVDKRINQMFKFSS
jgi:hypothetical protein